MPPNGWAAHCLGWNRTSFKVRSTRTIRGKHLLTAPAAQQEEA